MEISKKSLRRLFLGAAACIVLYWLLHETSRIKAFLLALYHILSPFIVGSAIAFVINVPLRAFEKILNRIDNVGLRRTIALFLTLIAASLVITGVVFLLIPQIRSTVESLNATLPGFFQRAEKMITDFLQENPQIMDFLINNTDLEKFDWASLAKDVMNFAGQGVGSIVDQAIAAVGSVASFIVNAVISIVFAIYALFRKEVLSRQGKKIIYSFLPEKACDEIVRILRLTNQTFSNFISGQCVEAVILGCMFAVSMLILRMPYIPLVSVLIAVTALIPVVGAFVGCVLGALFILVQSPVQALAFVAMFLVLQQIENNLIYPKVVGTSIGLPGMWVLVAVTVGGEVMGVGGMLVMIPLTSVMYTLMREITNRRLADRGISGEKINDTGELPPAEKKPKPVKKPKKK